MGGVVVTVVLVIVEDEWEVIVDIASVSYLHECFGCLVRFVLICINGEFLLQANSSTAVSFHA